MKEVIIGEEVFPGPGVATDEEILATVRKSFNTVYHASATNKMGKEGDAMAVVDSSCRVFGTKRLRVVDASAFPFLPPGHPMSTVCRFFPPFSSHAFGVMLLFRSCVLNGWELSSTCSLLICPPVENVSLLTSITNDRCAGREDLGRYQAR